jgi:hypothetical protein
LVYRWVLQFLHRGGVAHIVLGITIMFANNLLYIYLITAIPLVILLVVVPNFIKEDPLFLMEHDKT